MTLSAERRAELLAAAYREELVPPAERLLAGRDRLAPTVVRAPEVGMVMLQARESVDDERFYLGEVLVTQCTVEVAGALGWSMRGDDDKVAALAAAYLDAVAATGAPEAAEIEALCTAIDGRLARDDAEEWAAVAPTTVAFEELT